MKTFPVHGWLSPSSAFVKKRAHLAFSGVAHGSSVKAPKIPASSPNKCCGVSHSQLALEKCTSMLLSETGLSKALRNVLSRRACGPERARTPESNYCFGFGGGVTTAGALHVVCTCFVRSSGVPTGAAPPVFFCASLFTLLSRPPRSRRPRTCSRFWISASCFGSHGASIFWGAWGWG
jgi:hypothetical protein